ncbi:MAG: hypothetical protein B6I30_07830 [Desulfobacteraceae bacterium 4572_187]|nr:MAG: hypothetical protein B6I30_07830 [Desulfobacteraceae bacterium 4572_187]
MRIPFERKYALTEPFVEGTMKPMFNGCIPKLHHFNADLQNPGPMVSHFKTARFQRGKACLLDL